MVVLSRAVIALELILMTVLILENISYGEGVDELSSPDFNDELLSLFGDEEDGRVHNKHSKRLNGEETKSLVLRTCPEGNTLQTFGVAVRKYISRAFTTSRKTLNRYAKTVHGTNWTTLSSSIPEDEDVHKISILPNVPEMIDQSTSSFFNDVLKRKGDHQTEIDNLSLVLRHIDAHLIYHNSMIIKYGAALDQVFADSELSQATNNISQIIHDLQICLDILSKNFENALKKCGRKPDLKPIQEVVDSEYERFDFDDMDSRAIRTLRQINKGCKYLNDTYRKLKYVTTR